MKNEKGLTLIINKINSLPTKVTFKLDKIDDKLRKP